MTIVAFTVFALSHAVLIVMFEQQRKIIANLKTRNARLSSKNVRLTDRCRRQESQLRMLAEDFRK